MTDKQLTQHDSMSAFRERAALALVLTEFCVLALMPELAWAVDAPWDNVTGKLVISVKGMVEGITFIAVAVVSFLSYRGRVPWGCSRHQDSGRRGSGNPPGR